jgi:hypothetical protein
VAIYLNVLEDLARRKKFNIYVQPVAPVGLKILQNPTARLCLYSLVYLPLTDLLLFRC